jgi:hypothetical protein
MNMFIFDFWMKHIHITHHVYLCIYIYTHSPMAICKPLVQNSKPRASVCCSISIRVLPIHLAKKTSAMTNLQPANRIRICEQTVGYGWAWLCQASHNHLIQMNRGCLVSPTWVRAGNHQLLDSEWNKAANKTPNSISHISLDSCALCLKFLDICCSYLLKC